LRGGWQRISALGGDQAHVDLVLSEPITGETAYGTRAAMCATYAREKVIADAGEEVEEESPA
jgi:hypothetical protein